MPKTPTNNFLLTGRPGCGKTTVVRRVVERLSGQCLAGFYTQEVRESGRRVGFEAVGLAGSRMMLAHVDFDTARCVEHLRRVNPVAPVLTLSARTGEGLGPWLDWLRDARTSLSP